MLAALNHPNIATLYGLEQSTGAHYLVMELVPGETLAERLRKGPVGIEEALRIGGQIAQALEAAHEKGIVHRDLKPPNVKVTPEGRVKVLDFGLAKASAAEGALDISEGATLTALPTEEGRILGTPAYMSPEQARGKPVDKRTDIWAFGCALYAMLAGRAAFRGETSSDTIAAILEREPDWHRLPASTPAKILDLLRRCLQKDANSRLRDIGDARIEIEEALTASGERERRSRADRPIVKLGIKRTRQWMVAAGILLALGAVLGLGSLEFWRSRQRGEPARLVYTPLTNFADSATSPALSPDGRMLAFIRGKSTFFGPGQIYVKLLPDGEPVQLTNDNLVKMSPKFSPDGARIGYSTGIGNSIAAPDSATLDTWIVPVLGGQPRRLLTNAEGLTWSADGAGQLRVLFSELTGRGFQMSVAASTESRTEQRTVYAPSENGMAHRSYLSPDRQQVLVIEMGFNAWLPCRLVPYDGSSPGKPVGPAPAQCTDAAWSPDGKWMYFSADTGGGVHIWRQRFPDGTPEQVTFGVTEEEGIHFAPDGRSFVTSIGVSQSTVWIHDSHGDRQITSEGYSFWPSISPNGKNLYYLVRTGGPENFIKGGLWVADLDTGQRQRLLPDFQMQRYTISADGQRIVFVAVDEKGRSPVWLASLNGRTAPRLLTTIDSWDAYFGAPGEVVLEGEEKATAFIYRVKEDGSELQKMIPTPFLISLGVSPDGRWVPAQDSSAWGAMMLYPAGGGSPTRICEACSPPQGTEPVPPGMSWTPDRKFVYLKFAASTYAIPLKPGQVLPPIPASGFQSKEAVAALPGAQLVSEQEGVYPGPNPSVYAFVKVSTQRNIYRVPVP